MSSRTLPPLILHPFATCGGPDKLVESSRASLMLQGLLPCGDRTTEDLDRTLLEGRYSEILMLYYVGKDLLRWIDQCMECVERDPELRNRDIRQQSFAELLVNHSPEPVRVKLRRWGVADYRSIFIRALGLNVLFAEAPERSSLSADFIRTYYRYADQIFACRQSLSPFTRIEKLGFSFEIYASGEYSRMLEREWAEAEAR
ncbi:MAG: hypothetical protein JO062_24915 [Bryobacterales bacterium]|nr:hypothetical protein [Bryobacterales bacterium]